MEADDDHATIRESFSLVQNILFIEYIDVIPAHVQENMVEKLWKADAICFVFLIAYFGGNLWCPWQTVQCIAKAENGFTHFKERGPR